MGFFFFPIYKVGELISIGKCSELDIVLDLWLHAIYNDDQVMGSEQGPVVYYRNYTGNPSTSCQALGQRWGLSKSTAYRVLVKLEDLGFVRVLPFAQGTVIYLQNYMATMFQLSDVPMDKEEVALKLNLSIRADEPSDEVEVLDEQISVSKELGGVSFSAIAKIVRKVAKTLLLSGFSCVLCPSAQYILSNLSACGDDVYCLEIACPDGERVRFSLQVFNNKSKLQLGEESFKHEEV